MKKEIDFLKAYQNQISQKNISRFLTLGTVLFFIFYCIVAGATFSFWLWLKKEEGKINRQIENKKSQINQLRKQESLQILLKQRLSSLVKIWSGGKKDFPQFLNFFFQYFSSEVKPTEIKIPSFGEITVEGIASNSFSFANFLEKVIDAKDSKMFSKITLTGLTRQKDGSYKFSLSLIYGKK